MTFTLSNGNTIDAGYINAVTNVDNVLSSVSTNPVENKVITAALDTKVDKEVGKGLFSDEEKAKLTSIEDGAQVNVLEKLIINGQEATITDKSVALTIITSAVSNLQNYYLKTETYTKQEVEDLIGQTVGVTIEIVEQLPTEGQSNVIYFLPTETEDVYSQYIYTTDGWILIGSTTVDLSNYYTKAQVDALLNGKQNVLTIDAFPTALSNNPVASGGVYSAIASMQPQFQFTNMPVPSASNVGFVYQYIGTAGTYEPNMFYRCVYKEDIGEYQWVEVIFHATVTIDSVLSSTSTNPVQNKVIKEALDKKQNVMQYSTLPNAQDNLGAIVQYMGATTSDYTNGFFYKSIYDTESASYIWVLVEFAANITVDSALSTTSENPVQNKAITNKIGEIEDLIPNEASSTNQLVDRDSLGTASQKNFTPYVSPNDGGVPLSSSVYSAITSAVYGAYHPSGSKTIAELTSDLLVLANIGNVYKITEDSVTTDLFIGGAGQTIHTGDNAVVVYGGTPNTFLFDLQSGSIDLTPYQTKALTTSVVGETTVEGALSGLDTKETDDIKDVYEVMGKNGAKNLFPTNKTYYNGRSYTNNGITFVQNDDGSITVSGVATADAQYTLFTRSTDWGVNIDVGKSYILSGCPSGGSNDTYRLVFGDTQSSAYHRLAIDIGEGAEFTITTASETYYASSIDVRNGVDLTTPITFYPMLRYASDTDSTYQPYAMTNQQMTPYVQAISNPNLLDNPWFTVNQRALTTYTTPTSGRKYTVDRWSINIHLSATVDSNGITLTSDNSGINGDLEHRFENSMYPFLVNRLVTLSAKLSDGTIYSISGIINPAKVETIRLPLKNGWKIDINTGSSGTIAAYIFSDVNNPNSSITIRAVKLELGGVSTLAMDTAPNYATELLKCQRYFERNNWYDWCCVNCTTAGQLNLGMAYPFLVKKRTSPTFTFNVIGNTGIGNGYVRDLTDGTTIPASEVVLQQPSAWNFRMIQMKLAHSSFTVGHTYAVGVGDNTVDISADL